MTICSDFKNENYREYSEKKKHAMIQLFILWYYIDLIDYKRDFVFRECM